MDRHQLKKLLKNYRTPFDEEQSFINDFIELADHELAFYRQKLDSHFTASAWIVNKRRTHTLMTLHSKLNRWLQLGGHADGNENLVEVAMREAIEESGLASLRIVDISIFDIDKHIIPGNTKEPEHFHYDVRFLLEASLDEPLVISHESQDLAWIPFDSVEEMVGGDDSIMRMWEKTSKSGILL
ncbi:NUDIX hydrolase [Anditalea andensis]|uniref:NUDIX hydrolase n=1 Tax=Anditalea andensis TaxID=1048983 RepID=A0A074L3X0_9BACT|nr:NUDIX hydrolase [Anditalea andensis]KEO75120.1 NUDIX hydrolase [Anditalea andensis]